MARVSCRLLISGKVQGVSFRVSLREKAMHQRIDGWVRNRADGSVEALVQGEEADVDELVRWARRGPPGARVSSVGVERLELPARQDGFRVIV